MPNTATTRKSLQLDVLVFLAEIADDNSRTESLDIVNCCTLTKYTTVTEELIDFQQINLRQQEMVANDLLLQRILMHVLFRPSGSKQHFRMT